MASGKGSVRKNKKRLKDLKSGKGATTWTDSKGVITQTSKKGEKVGEHVSHHRGKGGKGKPNWKQKLGNQWTRFANKNKLKVKKK